MNNALLMEVTLNELECVAGGDVTERGDPKPPKCTIDYKDGNFRLTGPGTISIVSHKRGKGDLGFGSKKSIDAGGDFDSTFQVTGSCFA